MSNIVYDKDSIQSLEPFEHIRKRPGVYISSVDEDGLHHMLNEVIDNAVDEYIAGHNKTIIIKLYKNKSADKITVIDHGRGVPVGFREDLNCDIFTAIFSRMLTGGKFESGIYHTSGGTNGMGVKCVNALSKLFHVKTYDNHHSYSQEYKYGVPSTEIIKDKIKSNRTGTEVTFIPDKSILRVVHFNIDLLREKLSSIASILPGLEVELYIDDKLDLKLKESEIFTLIHNDVFKEKEICQYNFDSDTLKVRLSYHQTLSSSVKSFVNTVPTVDQGSHVLAVVNALINAIKTVESHTFTRSQIMFGMNLSLLLFYQEPVYRGQAKTKVEDATVYDYVYNLLYDSLYDYVKKNRSLFKYLKTISSSQDDALKEIKDAEKQIRIRNRNNALPHKLSIAYGCPTDKRELFIVEGKSAGGTINMARDSSFQEVLPLKGKIINAMRSSKADVLKSEETSDLFVSIGAIENDEYNIRCKNVFILADADADGGHIISLLLGLFHTLYPSFINNHNLYVIEAPLFSAISGDKRAYGKTVSEATRNFKSKYKGTPTIYRNKGLGEMNPEEMRDVIDPAKRTLIKIESTKNSDKVMTDLMSDSGTLRKIFIEDMK